MAKNYKPVYLKLSDEDKKKIKTYEVNDHMFAEWTMNDEIKVVEKRDREFRNLVLIIIALLLGSILKFLVLPS